MGRNGHLMVMGKRCKATRDDGQPCRAWARAGSDYCGVHDPANADAMAEARRLGGLRRRKELAVQGAYEVEGIASVADLQRVVLVGILDTLALENSVARNRTLGSLAMTAAKLLEVGELEERVKTLEAAVASHRHDEASVFDFEPTTLKLLDGGTEEAGEGEEL